MQGILMKPDMIAATVEGRKTNTRRAEASLREINKEPDKCECLGKTINGSFIFQLESKEGFTQKIVSPRYRVGETCYVKEAWRIEYSFKGCAKLDDLVTVHYSNASISRRWGDIIYNAAGVFLVSVAKAVDNPSREPSPMFMPEVLARHFIFVEAVAPGRVQEITIAGAVAEGVPCQELGIKNDELCRAQFADLWDSINPKYPFDSDPWVYAYQFRLES